MIKKGVVLHSDCGGPVLIAKDGAAPRFGINLPDPEPLRRRIEAAARQVEEITRLVRRARS